MSTLTYHQGASRRTGLRALTQILVICFLIAGQPAQADVEPASEIPELVIVNGEQITGNDLDRQLIKMHRRLSPEGAASFDYRRLLSKLVNDRLIVQEATAMAMDTEDGFAEFLTDALNRLAVGAFLKASYNPDLTIGDDEVLELFHKYYWKIQLRTLSCSDLDRAFELRGFIEDGASMDSLARTQSLDSRKYRGGLDKLKFWRDVPVVWQNAVRDLAVGELSDPLRYQDSWAIVRVEARQEYDTTDLSRADRDIRMYVRNQKKDSAWAVYLDSLAVFCPVFPDSAILQAIRQDAEKVYQADFVNGSAETVLRTSTGVIVSEDELRREVSYAAMKSGNLSFELLLERSLSRLTEDLTLKCAATRDGFDRNDLILSRLDGIRDSALIEVYCREIIVPDILFNRLEFDDYYDEHQKEFLLGDEVQLDDLQIVDRSRADSAAARLNAGADFGFISRLYGRSDPTHTDAMEWMALDKYPPEVESQLEPLKTGQTTGPIAVAEGWVIFRLRARRQGQPRPMDEVQIQIREVMFQRKFEEILDRHLAVLKSNSVIVFFDENIADYFGSEDKPAESRRETTE